MMGFGLGRLALAPDSFWAMTPLELAAALRAQGDASAGFMGGGAVQGPRRADFATLGRAFPD